MELTFAAGFTPKGLVVLANKNAATILVAYTNDYKKKEYFHIRELYQTDDGNWNPGKGVSVPLDQAGTLITTLSEAWNGKWRFP